MKKYLTNSEAWDEVVNGPYVNKNFKTVEEMDKIVEDIKKLKLSWHRKSLHDWQMSCNINSSNAVITWDEYMETNDRYAAFQIAFEKLGVKF